MVDGPDNIYVVMEYADGGSLLDYVRMRKRCPEHEARHFFTQMVYVVSLLDCIMLVLPALIFVLICVRM